MKASNQPLKASDPDAIQALLRSIINSVQRWKEQGVETAEPEMLMREEDDAEVRNLQTKMAKMQAVLQGYRLRIQQRRGAERRKRELAKTGSCF